MSVCITLDLMGKGDDNRPRPTRELKPQHLAALTKQPLPEGTQVTEEEVVVSLGRTTTLNDPLTTSLLNEVARRSQTQEFDDERIEELIKNIDQGDSRHPHVRRRTK
jgi:hypothetical protein